ncbi:UDP-4-amino-4-deoxy-L-arabinose--oxoglutarate aminotransferase [Desulfosporosinus acididurans]|uniref:UDP-4-amino-4-deoxy-L-arabinose--oxoglutarate aminotransferase n=1 Tax=Desulfosporosinus acididurans TaxID=476652 RepID=A0A0J1FQU1_9FIRM|nr:DegT/DnrJ/EryC1/StrS family aminotransferase [Desulfosporosinus acididurans]KLU65870.1 UDP-4-amino-4-deoxy-L-arabinose--oxoglutarate aminotransferase [Desulfosporosinus acididurans]
MMTEQLAICGGKPVRDTYLPYGKQWIGDEDVEAVAQILRGDFLTTGPAIAQFEQEVAAYVGAAFAAGIGENDEVITTPMTFAASANCVLYQKGHPVFADIDPLTGNIDPETIEDLITPKTRTIIPVDYTGRPVEIDKIRQISQKYGLTIIEDAAHAYGASYQGVRLDYRPECPQTERFYERIVTLPPFPAMKDQDVQDVIEAVHKVIAHYLR